jgi:hypothetical protein
MNIPAKMHTVGIRKLDDLNETMNVERYILGSLEPIGK